MPSSDAYEAYVKALGGRRVIRKILIANNGIAAVKAIRSIRRWSYETFGDDQFVQFVAMATPEDVRANAEYIRMADVWVDVPGGSNNHNFANVHLIADIADRYSCHAVWAGWGHASENPALPRKLAQLGVTFLGPDPRSMHALGDKIASTIIAQSAGVPTVAWSGKGLTCEYAKNKRVPDDLYKQACVTSAEHATILAADCGYPLVVKASEGGGGKGIRVVFDEGTIAAAYRQVASEVPGSPIFLMRLVSNARHLEVQLVADESGDAVALYGRDCSVQRRHQKIIEEGPVVAAPTNVWKRLEDAAVALAKEVGYVGAGTVEYLYTGDQDGGEFYFLELNPRLQVEHPVTEWITGVNLPALQLHIGMGIPLKSVPSIRKFFNLPDISILDSSLGLPLSDSATSQDSETEMCDEKKPWHGDPRPPHGHVIACRITAENPDEGFQPTSGDIQELTFRNTPNVWGYFSVGASGGVHEFADSQFGHLFAWGETRESSRRSLVLALKELSIRGDIRTTVEYIIKLMELKAFRENMIDTAWLDSLIADHVTAEKPPTELAIVIGAVCRAHELFTQRAATFTKCLERGQLPPLDQSLVEFPVELIYNDVKYCFQIRRADVSAFRVRLQGEYSNSSHSSVLVELRTLADGAKLVVANGRSHVCYAREEPAGFRLSIDGKSCLFPKEYDPTILRSTVNGKVVRFLVDSGDHVDVGQTYAEMEVMKMYLSLSAPEAGKVTILKPEGSGVDVGTVLATLALDDPSKVRRAEIFKGSLPSFDRPHTIGAKPHQVFAEAKKNVSLLLQGFDAEKSALETFIDLLDDPRVAAGEFREALAALVGRISPVTVGHVESAIEEILECCSKPTFSDSGGKGRKAISLDLNKSQFDEDEERTRRMVQMRAISVAASKIVKEVQKLPAASALSAIASNYVSGSVLAQTVGSLLDEYLAVERPFAKRANGAGDAMFELRESYKDDLSALVEIAASHVNIRQKNEVMVSFLQALLRPEIAVVLGEDNSQTADFKTRLHQLSQLFAPAYSDIALRARLLLADFRRPRFHQRKRDIQMLLESVLHADEEERDRVLQRIIGLSESILDVLVTFVLPAEQGAVSAAVRKIAAEAQVLRSYRAYNVCNLRVIVDDYRSSVLTASWKFQFCKRLNESGLSSPTTLSPGHQSPNGMSHVGHGIASFDSADNLIQIPGDDVGALDSEAFRKGFLMAFATWAEMEKSFDEILEQCIRNLDASHQGRNVNVMTVLLRWDTASVKRTRSGNDFEHIRIDGAVSNSSQIPYDPLASEEYVSDALSMFCRSKRSRRDMVQNAGVKTVTFIVVPPAGESTTYPGFYTFRVRDDFKEDPIFRHIDPPMAFQLELARLSNFNITRFGYPARTLHVFFAQDKAVSKRRLPPLQKKESFVGNSEAKISHQASVKSVPNVVSDGMKSHSVADRSPNGKSFAKAYEPEDKFSISVAASKKSTISGQGVSVAGHGRKSDRDVDARFFVRAVIRQADVFSSSQNGGVISIPEAERTFVEALDAVEMASCDRRFRRTDFNHIFLNVIPAVQIDIDDVEAICRRMFQRYAARCWNLRVFVVEIKVPAIVNEVANSTSTLPLRFLLYNPTGHMLKVESYVESIDPHSGVERILSVSQDNQGSLHRSPVTVPYPVMDRIQRKRVVAQAIETTYVYDFLQIFTKQLHLRWRQYSEDRLLGGFRRHKMPLELIESKELVLRFHSETGQPELEETSRDAGLNDVGMVAWRCKLFTPEYPNGREAIIIANDITFQSGSFGPEEDALFVAASRLARKDGIPRIYLAANSGARIGVAAEVRDRIQAKWVDPKNPSKGIEALAIDENDLKDIPKSVYTGKKLNNNLIEVTDVLGNEHGLGVENLMGSGLIAGETSRAYDEIFTLTYVTARTVGIGAYLVRLGQRVIQKESAAPIILTGFSALNKVLGHDLYMSNEQLGGTKVMFPNGVTHSVVKDDVEGVGAILDWLSFVPRRKGDPVPVIESRDSVSRPIQSASTLGQAYDPRTKLLAGEVREDGRSFLGGFFDKDSWQEYLQGWAKTVITGRARLGGVPAGVIAVETRSVERVTPADPASPETFESVVMQAGQVWYPDSAAKTGQAIKDFNREGLPLFIFANWRGFSGGMRDMFDEVLKTGSTIVDALREYKHPVFVYIPKGAELRGGAWVVLDTLINPEYIEMYADPSARGGVLEPEGTVDVKYRRREILKTMHRLDEQLIKLDAELSGGKSGVLLSDERKRAVHDEIYSREAELLPIYRNLAVSFCDLHDTPGRLLAKNAIRKVVPWEEARGFFYWRLQRRLAEDRVRKMCARADPSLSMNKITGLLRKWAASYRFEGSTDRDPVLSSHIQGSISRDDNTADFQSAFDSDDQWVFQWLEVEEDSIVKKISKIRASYIANNVREIFVESRDGFLDGIEHILRSCSNPAAKQELVTAIHDKIARASSSQGAPSTTRSILSRFKVGWDTSHR